MTKNCKPIGGKMVCGMLHGGGVAHKHGVFRLRKGERVLTPAQLKHLKRDLGCRKPKCAKKNGKKICHCNKK